MNAFEAMLDELAAAPDGRRPARVVHGATACLDGPPIAAVSPVFAAARYADAATSPDAPAPTQQSSRARSALAWERLLDEAERSGASVKRLEALRRELAWAFHPDRTGDDPDRSMTRFNARIDALIARARRILLAT